MLIRAFVPHDLEPLIALTIDTFGPFYEDVFRPLAGEAIFTNQHGDWRDDYRRMVPALHAPARHRYIAVAETGDGIIGYVAWSVDPVHRNGTITLLAVSARHRRQHAGRALCEHAFAHMRTLGAEVVEISTGGDPFHDPARALYEELGCTPLPLTVYYRQL